MEEHRADFKVLAMSRALGVSRSGFYAWRLQQDNPSPRRRQRDCLDATVKQAFEDRKGRSGAPRLVLDMATSGASA